MDEMMEVSSFESGQDRNSFPITGLDQDFFDSSGKKQRFLEGSWPNVLLNLQGNEVDSP
jgi:hypothetical protein